jgi:hypothetical protein
LSKVEPRVTIVSLPAASPLMILVGRGVVVMIAWGLYQGLCWLTHLGIPESRSD